MAVTFPTTTPEKINLVDDDLFLIANSEDGNDLYKSKKSSVLSGTQATLVSGTNIKTINGDSVLGSGDLNVIGSGDLGDVYDNGSLITTDATNTSVKIRTGSGADTDVQFEVQNTASQKMFTVTGEGEVSATGVSDTSLTANELISTNPSKKLVSLPVATYPSLTEISYVKGVTSGIQNQLGTKIGTTLGAVGSSPNSNGATVTGTTLNLEPANLSNPGVVTATAQTFGGVKSFANTFVDATGGANRASALEIANTGNLSEFVITDAINLEVTDNFNHGTLASVFFASTQSGNGDIDILGGALGSSTNDGTGTITDAIGVQGSVENGSTGVITNAYGLRAVVTESAGTITNGYGLKIEDIAVSGTSYAIKTGAGLVDLGDTTNIASASADYHQLTGGTGTITDTATGSSTNININLVPKGTGRLQAGGVNVPTISSTDTLTNKTLTSPVINVTSDATGDMYYRNGSGLFTRLGIGSAGQVLQVDSGLPSWQTPSSGGGGFWTTVPGTPTRTSDTVFTITDTSNANLYDQLLQRGTVLKRTQSGTKQAMVVSATYAADTVTVTIIGDTLSVGFTDMKYGLEKARVHKFALAGTIGATGTNVMNTVMIECPTKIFGADFRAGTAGDGTTTVDINKGGTTMFTTKPSITTTNQNVLGVSADNGTTATTGDYITIDVDAVAGTTKIIDAYINLYHIPLYMANLA